MSSLMVSDLHLSFLFLPQMNWVSIRRQVSGRLKVGVLIELGQAFLVWWEQVLV